MLQSGVPFFILQPQTVAQEPTLLHYNMTFIYSWKIFLLLLCFSISTGYPASVEGSNLSQEINATITNGGYIVTKDNTIIAQHNPDELYTPASILKIATSLAALEILGPAYRYQTEFYVTQEKDLYIKGFGDPFFTSEEVRLILSTLHKNGVDRINNIFLDASSFQLQKGTDGSRQSLNPYDAENSALAANFNTINIIRSRDGTIKSAEPQTPTLPIMRLLGANLSPGEHRINISKIPEHILLHTGELFRAIQKEFDIAGDGSISVQVVPPGISPFHVHLSSKTVGDIIPSLLLYSNNYIANQLFLSCGSQKFGYPATWEKGRLAMTNFLNDKGLNQSDVRLLEGSGLSSQNKMTPKAMITILDKFKPYTNMLPKTDGQFIKTGTLTGVYSYAGYFVEAEKKHSFVLILNQTKNTRSKILKSLKKIFKQKI